MKWVKDVTKHCDWKSTFGPEEIVEAICSIIETKDVSQDVDLISDEELKNLANKPLYAVYHKPTKLWVYFRELKDKFGLVGSSIICLCLKPDATTSTSKEQLKHLIKIGEFNSEPLYGQNNFLEFQIKKV